VVGKIRQLGKWINRRSACDIQLSGSLFGKQASTIAEQQGYLKSISLNTVKA